MESLESIKILIQNDDIEAALRALETLLPGLESPQDQSEAFYLRGNAYRKLTNWKEAMNSYQQAIDLNPNSPAVHAHKMLIDILEFYHKDMFNQ